MRCESFLSIAAWLLCLGGRRGRLFGRLTLDFVADSMRYGC